ncbi:MAG TPA: hypothetical protein VG013_18125 [Gemmataceae bacterium]|jgi:hypothetical protein|nr:hypothetical protein [Gemmataceae bacterium]
MVVTFQCPCGKPLQAPAEHAGQAVECPECGRVLTIPAPGPGRLLWPRLAAAAGVTLLIMVGLGFLLVGALPLLDRGRHGRVASGTPTSRHVSNGTDAGSLFRSQAPSSAKGSARTAEAGGQRLPAQEQSPPAGSAYKTTPVSPLPARPVVKHTRPAKETPAVAGRLHLKLRAGDRFYQEVVVRRVSSYRLLGSDLGQNVQYTLVSSFQVDKRGDDGSLKVRQKVEVVRLGNADANLQARLNTLLQKMKGATFTLTLSPRMEVTKFEGAQEALKVFGGDDPLGGQTFLLWSFMDQDGWKELAQLSFFQPAKPLRAGEKWSRGMSHSWGQLGGWAGRARYEHAGKQAGLDQFRYVLDLAYRPPAKGGGGLPFQIDKADFRTRTARGVIAFDAARGRVAAVEEQFHVQGVLSISYLDVASAVQMDETQVFQLRLLDRNPLAK